MRWTSREWDLVAGQQEVVTRRQLRDFGWSDRAIDLQIGRLLHRLHRGVFAVGHARMSAHRRWRAALLACGPGATLSHASAAAFWGFVPRDYETHVSVPGRHPKHTGITVHERSWMPRPQFRDGLRVSDPIDTLIDLAHAWPEDRLERALDHADKNRLFTIDVARERVEELRQRPG